MTATEATTLERLMQRASPERAALDELVPVTGESRASVLHALLSVGMEAVREGIRRVAVLSGEDDEWEIRTARRRQLTAWRGVSHPGAARLPPPRSAGEERA